MALCHNLSIALVMWVVGVKHEYESLCAVRQYVRFLPTDWTLVTVHDSSTPGLRARIANESQGHQLRQIYDVELTSRLPAFPAKRVPLYHAVELQILLRKLFTWSLVEYDRVLSVDTDVYIAKSPFHFVNCEMLSYTADPRRIVATPACSKYFNGGFLFFRPDMNVTRLLLRLSHLRLARVCEMKQSDQTVLNTFFHKWRAVEIVHSQHHTLYDGGEIDSHSVVHFVGLDKPHMWFRQCALTNWVLQAPRPPPGRKGARSRNFTYARTMSASVPTRTRHYSQ
mmetsp:Transcript_20991/g.64174  ORF Transcript_20991/g.64174 Transcript_20991/m.64174 type:complete len:282 (-) Transcript_20991:358-1203(-)